MCLQHDHCRLIPPVLSSHQPACAVCLQCTHSTTVPSVLLAGEAASGKRLAEDDRPPSLVVVPSRYVASCPGLELDNLELGVGIILSSQPSWCVRLKHTDSPSRLLVLLVREIASDSRLAHGDRPPCQLVLPPCYAAPCEGLEFGD